MDPPGDRQPPKHRRATTGTAIGLDPQQHLVEHRPLGEPLRQGGQRQLQPQRARRRTDQDSSADGTSIGIVRNNSVKFRHGEPAWDEDDNYSLCSGGMVSIASRSVSNRIEAHLTEAGSLASSGSSTDGSDNSNSIIGGNRRPTSLPNVGIYGKRALAALMRRGNGKTRKKQAGCAPRRPKGGSLGALSSSGPSSSEDSMDSGGGSDLSSVSSRASDKVWDRIDSSSNLTALSIRMEVESIRSHHGNSNRLDIGSVGGSVRSRDSRSMMVGSGGGGRAVRTRGECHSNLSARKCARTTVAIVAAIALATLIYAVADGTSEFDLMRDGGDLFGAWFRDHGRRQETHSDRRLPEGRADVPGDARTNDGLWPQLQLRHRREHEPEEDPEEISATSPHALAVERVSAPASPRYKKNRKQSALEERNRKEHLEKWKD